MCVYYVRLLGGIETDLGAFYMYSISMKLYRRTLVYGDGGSVYGVLSGRDREGRRNVCSDDEGVCFVFVPVRVFGHGGYLRVCV